MIRADECIRLAKLTQDSMIQAVLLRRRRMYLKMAKNLALVSDVISSGATARGSSALSARDVSTKLPDDGAS